MGRAGAAYRTERTTRIARGSRRRARRRPRRNGSVRAHSARRSCASGNSFEVQTRAAGKDEYLLRPDLGRHFDESSRLKIQERCARGSDLQIVIGDGLSVPAVSRQVPALLPSAIRRRRVARLESGRTFVIRYCRVGILNEIGELLDPRVVVLLIGERPGLATAESLSAYMAYRPRAGHSDADRNLISNIHARGVTSARAAARILNLAAQMMQAEASGCSVKENL